MTPPHAPRDVALPKKTRMGIQYVVHQPDLRCMKWWEQLHDPVLNQLIKDALINNNQIKNARANVLQARAKLQQARYAWLPTLNAAAYAFTGGGWDTQFTPEINLARFNLPNTITGGAIRFRGYYAGFVPKYSLNILQNQYNERYAKSSLCMQKAIYMSTRLSVISQISGSYFMLLGQQEQLQEQLHLIQDLRAQRQLEWSRYRKGGSDISAVTNLDQQIATNEASLPTMQNSIAQVENAIRVLLNRNPGPIFTKKDISSFNIQGMIPASIPSAVLRNRPDIISSEESLNMAKANVGLTYANFFPTIPLTGFWGKSSFELIHLLKLNTGLWLATAAASMPLLNAPYYAQIKAAKAGYKAAYYSYIQTLKSAFADVDNNLTNQSTSNQHYEYLKKALQSSQTAYALALSRYKAGAKDYRDVLSAAVNVDNAQIALTVAKMQQMDSLVNLYQALAGGYLECKSCKIVCIPKKPRFKSLSKIKGN